MIANGDDKRCGHVSPIRSEWGSLALVHYHLASAERFSDLLNRQAKGLVSHQRHLLRLAKHRSAKMPSPHINYG
jgi:hypothetical protein